MLKTTKEPDFK